MQAGGEATTQTPQDAFCVSLSLTLNLGCGINTHSSEYLEFHLEEFLRSQK